MAATMSPVELPTNRRSYPNDTPVQDFNDPKWIPILNGSDVKFPAASSTEKELSPYSTSSFSPFPTQSLSPKRKPSPPSQRPSFTHKSSNSTISPENVVSGAQVGLPQRVSAAVLHSKALPESPHHARQTSGGGTSDEEETSTSGHTTDDASVPSTAGTISLVEEQYYVLPSLPVAKEDILPPTRPPSSRMSTALARKTSSVLPPTSKYSRKPLPCTALTVIGQLAPLGPPETPREAPQLTPAVPSSQYATPLVQPLPSPQIPQTESSPEPESTPKIMPMKSTAAERRQRALHSHPSNLSLQGRSRKNSTTIIPEHEAETKPKSPSVKHRSRKSTDSRPTTPRSTIYDPTPTPAPTTPLPELPAHVRKLSTKQVQSPTEAHMASPALPSPSSRAGEHPELSSFMTTTSTVVFRRFDDVHVRLLLCLQDEIAQLEKELLLLENGSRPPTSPAGNEKSSQRTRVLRDLRKVVAEYDHLFANWSQMQANKASRQTMRDLKQWLEKPQTSAGGAVVTAKNDLEWLENSKDLSCVQLGADGWLAGDGREIAVGVAGRHEGGGGGFFAKLFGSCAGRRR